MNEIKTLNGHPIADMTAREGVDRLAEQIIQSTDDTLVLENGILRVNVAENVDYDNEKPVRSSAVASKIIALRSGGRNLFLGTGDFSGNNWDWSLPQWIDAGETYDGLAVKMKNTAWGGISQPVRLKAGLEYTLSAWIKRTDGAEIVFYGENTDRNDTSVTDMCGPEWQRVHMTFKIYADGDCTPRFENIADGETMYICGLMLERSNVPSDWSPAPEDVALANDVDRLAEEIDALKEEGGISGGTTTTRSGTLITMDCDEGTEIVVEGEAAEAVTLVHCGKNLLPPFSEYQEHCYVTYTPNADGTVTLNGTANADAWPQIIPQTDPMHLPAGTYTLSATKVDANVNVCVGEVNGSWACTVGTPSVKSIVVPYDCDVYAFMTVVNGTVNQNRIIAMQLEAGTEATEYEPYTKDIQEVALPVTLSAHAGVNNIYTESGDELTATAKKSVATLISEAVAKQLSVDWSVYGLPILYLTGDTTGMSKDNAVTLDYVYGERKGTCTVKWQGSSSLSFAKKNYTIKFDNAFEARDGWGAQKKYCFKANYIDHSHARNICSCKLWGEIVKSRASVPTELANLVNGGAIDGFPCVIMLNGEFHGLYTWNIPKDGWMFGSPKAILCADAHVAATEFYALATLDGDFELEYVEDESNADWVLPSLNTAIQSVIDGNLDEVAKYIDIPSAIDYYIHTVDENANDCTDKNYILVTFDGVKWYFSAYDRDSIYGLHYAAENISSPATGVTFAEYADMHKMMELIRSNMSAELKARAIELREGVKSEANVATVFSNFIGSIPSQLYDADAKAWPMLPMTSVSNLTQILNWYRLRRQILDAEIDAM